MKKYVACTALCSLLLLPVKAIAAQCNRIWLSPDLPGAEHSIAQFERAFAKQKFGYSMVKQRMQLFRVPGVSVAYVKGDHVLWAKSYGVLQQGSEQCVEIDTVFSVASISKVVASMMTLLLTQQRTLGLDTDVNSYLKSWKVEGTSLSRTNPVTLRHIMSHTAGFNVHGFSDFQPNETLPNTVQILKGLAPAKNSPINLIYEPGKVYSYSGGGTTVMQLVIEDVMHMSFEQAADKLLFHPLGMDNSSFETPAEKLSDKVAKAHDRFGQTTALPRGWESMPEKAASGLWTNAYDLGLLMAELLRAFNASTTTLFEPEVIRAMMTKQANSKHGLGPILDGETFYHGGANDSYRALFHGNLSTSSGFIILANSASADSLIDEIQDAMKAMGNH
ncbi:class A beta-lactamase-related serine hydrolase [Alteromonas sediminis]|uniref:Class A beta-lactamase-related serine hydrolase n=1 Tax=Alteromonas sediminis TaxID=2259342 RepID=A0A3N5XY36_9ALTE|nr:serine hydrolase domain-containing protein [Alteromonas sediminis]RPJ65802.1 class A beta-lactamase-related serine hydrolase [Alteromonas sediminis]